MLLIAPEELKSWKYSNSMPEYFSLNRTRRIENEIQEGKADAEKNTLNRTRRN